jgi:ketosteroid isomerase-like protein
VQPSAPKPVPLAADAPAEIKALVAAYAHAIEQRDVAALRRLYPDMAPAQQTNFQEFFGYVRTLRASLSVSSLEVDGATAEARLTGAYEYVTNAGRSERQPVNVQATMRRESAGWRFVAIR